MKVFLTGATGYIGSAVADALRGAGHDVMGLARSADATARLIEMGVQPVGGDFADAAALAAATGDADGVISIATSKDPSVDAAAVGVMLERLRGTGKAFIYTSGIWSYGDTGGRVVTETSRATPAALVAWRAAVERAVLDAASGGVRSVVIQPGVVYGRGGGIPATYVKSARRDGAGSY